MLAIRNFLMTLPRKRGYKISSNPRREREERFKKLILDAKTTWLGQPECRDACMALLNARGQRSRVETPTTFGSRPCVDSEVLKLVQPVLVAIPAAVARVREAVKHQWKEPPLRQTDWEELKHIRQEFQRLAVSRSSNQTSCVSGIKELGRTVRQHPRRQPDETRRVFTSDGAARTGSKLPSEAQDILQAWFLAHVGHPYPTKGEKLELMKQTGLSKMQNWFTNLRKRHWEPLRNGREPRCHFDVAMLAELERLPTVSLKPKTTQRRRAHATQTHATPPAGSHSSWRVSVLRRPTKRRRQLRQTCTDTFDVFSAVC